MTLVASERLVQLGRVLGLMLLDVDELLAEQADRLDRDAGVAVDRRVAMDLEL